MTRFFTYFGSINYLAAHVMSGNNANKLTIIMKSLRRSPSLPYHMSWSQLGRVCRRGVIFKKLGICPLILTSKPVIGFENSIQVHN